MFLTSILRSVVAAVVVSGSVVACGGGSSTHAGGMIGVLSKAAAADVPGGAKIAFVAHAKHFATGMCAMGDH